jgi:hypothetical protein
MREVMPLRRLRANVNAPPEGLFLFFLFGLSTR